MLVGEFGMLLKQWFEKSVPIMGFGGIPIMSGKDSEFLVRLKNVEYEKSLELIKKAIDLGVVFFDTALDYGDSEEKIGKVTQNCRDKVILATKSKALTYDEMMYSVEKSLKNLSTDYIDVYQLHFVKDTISYNTIMGDNGAYKALEKLKTQKVIREIGVASHNYTVLQQAIEDNTFFSVQLPYNVIENDSVGVINEAKKKNIKVIIMKPFAGGALTQIHPKLLDVIASESELRYLALKFIAEQPISIIIPGMSTEEELLENYKILNNDAPLTFDDKEKISQIREVIGQTFCRRCQYCEPCPQGIEIAKIFRFNKYYEDYNLPKWAREQYFLLPIGADKCVGCYSCENKCPYNLKIVSKLEEIHRKMCTSN